MGNKICKVWVGPSCPGCWIVELTQLLYHWATRNINTISSPLHGMLLLVHHRVTTQIPQHYICWYPLLVYLGGWEQGIVRIELSCPLEPSAMTSRPGLEPGSLDWSHVKQTIRHPWWEPPVPLCWNQTILVRDLPGGYFRDGNKGQICEYLSLRI